MICLCKTLSSTGLVTLIVLEKMKVNGCLQLDPSIEDQSEEFWHEILSACDTKMELQSIRRPSESSDSKVLGPCFLKCL